MTNTIIRVSLGVVGVWISWAGLRTSQVQKLNGVRVVPKWSRILMVFGRLFCIVAPIFGTSTHL